MTDFQVITRERHGHQHWLSQSGFLFASGDALCPLVAQELPGAVLSLPIGFVAEGEYFMPVAVQGLTPGQAAHTWLFDASHNAEDIGATDLSSGKLSLPGQSISMFELAGK